MNSENNAEKTPGRGKGRPFEPGNPGRPKGIKNKISKSIKEAYEYVFEQRGGKEGFLIWVNASKRNTELFYQWHSRMLPSNISQDIDANVNIVVTRKYVDERPPEE